MNDKRFVKRFVAASMCLALAQPVVGTRPIPSQSTNVEMQQGTESIDPMALYSVRQPIIESLPLGNEAGRRADLSSQVSAGPDDFGYTWASVPFTWISATQGINAGLTGNQQTGPLTLPFNFKFYENVYHQVFLSANGIVGFNDCLAQCGTWTWMIPNPDSPNNFIAPYWATLNVPADGGVYYHSGGSAPNRWWVAEWYRVKDEYTTDRYTFEVILYEGGDIEFRYLSIDYAEHRSAPLVGIEDALGVDGLGYLPFPFADTTRLALHYTRPPASARTNISPASASASARPGDTLLFTLTLRNTGDLGTDTFDTLTSSSWPVALVDPNTGLALTDTNGNGIADTGPLAAGATRTFITRFTTPGSAQPGNTNAAIVTARSTLNPNKTDTTRLTTAVPALFAQGYVRNTGTDPSRPKIDIYWPGQIIHHSISNARSAAGMSIVSLPEGNIAATWSQSGLSLNGQWISEIYYELINRQGNLVRPPVKVTDRSLATTRSYDTAPAIAVAPDGTLALVWTDRQVRSSDNADNTNIRYMILDAQGQTVAAGRMTQNADWLPFSSPNHVHHSASNIIATNDNRFIITWSRWANTPAGTVEIWYSVMNSQGVEIKAPAPWRSGTCSAGVLTNAMSSMTRMADGSIFVAGDACGNIQHGRLSTAGAILSGPTNFTTNISTIDDNSPDAVQLSNGNIVLAWSHHTGLTATIQYATLGPDLATVQGVTNMPNIGLYGGDAPSLVRASDKAVLTWGDYGITSNLYYALLSDQGNLVTPPIVLVPGGTFEYAHLSFNGQGNAELLPDTTPPVTPTLDSKLYLPVLRR